MRTILRIIVSLMLTYGLLSLTNCSGNNDGKDKDSARIAFESDRTQVAEDLREIRDDISYRIERIGESMENASESTRGELSELNEELLQQRERVDAELERVESASAKNWREVREGAENTFRTVKSEFSELRDQISD